MPGNPQRRGIRREHEDRDCMGEGRRLLVAKRTFETGSDVHKDKTVLAQEYQGEFLITGQGHI